MKYKKPTGWYGLPSATAEGPESRDELLSPIPGSISSPPTRVPWHSPDHCPHPPGTASHLHQGTANWEPTTAPPSLVAQTVKSPSAMQKIWVWSLDSKTPGKGHGNTLQYSCLENPHGQRSLVGYSPWGHKELGKTEWLSTAQYMG